MFFTLTFGTNITQFYNGFMAIQGSQTKLWRSSWRLQEGTGRSQLESKRGLSGVGEGPGGQFERPENDPRRFQEVLDVVLGLLGGSGVRSGSKRLFEEGLRP